MFLRGSLAMPTPCFFEDASLQGMAGKKESFRELKT